MRPALLIVWAMAALLVAAAEAPKEAAKDAPKDIAPEKAPKDTPQKENEPKNEADGDTLPAELNMETFDAFTAEHLTLVEFYSPFCSHCKDLAPIWKEAFKVSKDDQEALDVHMRQVNCVQFGDLCLREAIRFYPNLRLYAPQQEGKAKFVDSYPKALGRTPENFHKYLRNVAVEYLGKQLASASVELDTDTAMKMVAGELAEPYMVALFPVASEAFQPNTDDSSGAGLMLQCLDCAEYVARWSRLLNLVATVAKTAHIPCHTNPNLCKLLGFGELGDRSLALLPRYVMFVPRGAGRIRFDYTAKPTVPDMQRFVTKMAHNYRYDMISINELEDLAALRLELPTEPQDLYYPLSNKIALVFVFNKDLVTPEDKRIMPYLLQLATDLPFDVSLYTLWSPKFPAALEHQSKSLTHFVNLDLTFHDVPFNRKMFLMTLLSSSPTLYIFKENSLIPAVYQNFAIEDLRMPEKFEPFVQQNLYPWLTELTPDLYSHYFSKKGAPNKDDLKVVITFLSPSNGNGNKEIFHNVSLAQHQHHIERKEYYYNKVMAAREEKDKKVQEMKQNNEDSVSIIQQMRENVPHLFDHHDVKFTFVDIEQYPDFARNHGLNIDGHVYKSGDTIVVSKNQFLYWDATLDGRQLTTNREDLRTTLKYLLDPTLFKGRVITSKLVGSPYHRHLRYLDFMHQHGVVGYVVVMFVCVLLYQGLKRAVRRSPGARRTTGIIGNMSKSD